MKTLSVFAVALHPEGVDRNTNSFNRSPSFKSPSTRRAWIEILSKCNTLCNTLVALHPEGVDRNTHSLSYFFLDFASPSTRRAWIEIAFRRPASGCRLSPSTRRAWIEIAVASSSLMMHAMSPSTRRAWIEIPPQQKKKPNTWRVALHPEGVDRNIRQKAPEINKVASPSTRRAWIEMRICAREKAHHRGRPPPGGRG